VSCGFGANRYLADLFEGVELIAILVVFMTFGDDIVDIVDS